MTKTGSWIAHGLRIGLSALLVMLTIFVAGLIGLIVIALTVPTMWPANLTISTAIPGLDLPTVTPWGRLVYCMQNGIMAALLTLVLVPLYRIVRSVSKGAPFTDGNVRHFRIIAVTFMTVAIGRIFLPIEWLVYSPFLGSGGALNVVAAMLVLTLAEIFREGVRLREDSELAV